MLLNNLIERRCSADAAAAAVYASYFSLRFGVQRFFFHSININVFFFTLIFWQQHLPNIPTLHTFLHTPLELAVMHSCEHKEIAQITYGGKNPHKSKNKITQNFNYPTLLPTQR